MFRTLALILSGNVAVAIIMLVRNLLVSRLLSVEDYGIASTFLIAVSLIEMVSALGLRQQMVQSKDGDDPYLQAAFQGFHLLRGIVNSIVLFAIAAPLADFFGRPDVVWAYRLIALIPLVDSMNHFDVQRLSRQMRYRMSVLTGIVPPALSLLLVWPLYLVFHDYRVLLFVLLFQYALSTIMSQVMAERRWKITLDRVIITGSLAFGWPLMVDGGLLFAVFNGERLIVARQLGLEALAQFSLAFSLTLPPALMISKTAMSFFLPQVSGVQSSPKFLPLSAAVIQSSILAGGVLTASIAIFAGPFIHAVLGEKYAAAIPLLTWLGIVQAFRVWKGGCSIVALAQGYTRISMWANILRVGLLPIAWVIVELGGSLVEVIWIAIGAEAGGFILALAMSMYRQNLPLRPLVAPIASCLAVLGVAAIHAAIQEAWVPDWRTSVLMVLLCGVIYATSADLRVYLRARTFQKHEA